MTDNVYRLRRRPPPGELVHCLELLLKNARSGRLVGIAFIGLTEGNGFIADACGDARKHPEETRVLVPKLDAKLLRLGRQQHE